MIDYDAIPAELAERDQWVCWVEEERDGKRTKAPRVPFEGVYASVRRPETWSSLETVYTHYTQSDISGVGFVFTAEDDFVGIDLDDCLDPNTGRPEAWAKEIVATLDSYTEVSPSGTGYHVIVKGSLPEGGNRSGSVEMYESARFFTVTGQHVEGLPTSVEERNDELAAVHAEHVASPLNLDSDVTKTHLDSGSQSKRLDDEALLQKARRAKNGEKFQRLWGGDTSGYASHSEADMALAFLLAFWTGNEVSQMDRLFRRSGLMREKWDETHYSDGDTYGTRTLERAITMNTETYSPDRAERSDPSNSVPFDVSRIQRRIDSLERELDTLTDHCERLIEIVDEERAIRREYEVRLEELSAQVESDSQSSWWRLFP